MTNLRDDLSIVFCQYNYNEINILRGMLCVETVKQMPNYFSQSAWEHDFNVEPLPNMIDRFFIYKGIHPIDLLVDIFSLPIKEMPLYINHEKWVIRLIAQWRLKIGR